MTKILVAEDDNFLASAYKAKLKKANYEVSIVSDGTEVLKSLQSSVPDLIILDLVMPKMDGFSTLQELKKNPDYAQIPVIVASNLGQAEDIQKAKKLGASDYLVKSDLSMKSLIDKIQKKVVKASK